MVEHASILQCRLVFWTANSVGARSRTVHRTTRNQAYLRLQDLARHLDSGAVYQLIWCPPLGILLYLLLIAHSPLSARKLQLLYASRSQRGTREYLGTSPMASFPQIERVRSQGSGPAGSWKSFRILCSMFKVSDWTHEGVENVLPSRTVRC